MSAPTGTRGAAVTLPHPAPEKAAQALAAVYRFLLELAERAQAGEQQPAANPPEPREAAP